MGREVGKLTIGIVLAILLLAIVAMLKDTKASAMKPVEPARLPMNVRVMKVDSARGVVCYGAVDLVLGTTLSCVKVTP